MKNKASIPNERIIDKVHVIQNQKLILDYDLAELFGVETKRLKSLIDHKE